MPTVTLTGIGGAQQTAIAAAFSAQGWAVRGTSRTSGPNIHSADLETGAGLAEALAGSDVVVFTLPQDHRPGVKTAMAHAVASAAAKASVGRIVLNTAARVAPASPLAIFAEMRAARDALFAGPVPTIALQPTIFMDNLLAPWALPGIQAGTLAYPAPRAAPIAWISHATLAKAVLAAATADALGQSIPIGGPQALTGDEMASALAAHLGHPVGYAEIPLPDFAAGLNAAFGAPAGDRIAELYADLAQHPASQSDGQDGLARLGVTGETFADFLSRTLPRMAA